MEWLGIVGAVMMLAVVAAVLGVCVINAIAAWRDGEPEMAYLTGLVIWVLVALVLIKVAEVG